MAEPARKAKNEAVFREVNDRIEDIATEFGVPDEASFVCECGDADCTQMLHMTLREYNEVRRDGRSFVILPGHEDPTIEKVVARNGRFSVVEKVGEAGHIADALDPRDDG
jgi:hypothetical protein